MQSTCETGGNSATYYGTVLQLPNGKYLALEEHVIGGVQLRAVVPVPDISRAFMVEGLCEHDKRRVMAEMPNLRSVKISRVLLTLVIG